MKPKNTESVTVSIVSPSICHEGLGPDVTILVFRMLSFKPAFFTLFFHFHQEALFISSISLGTEFLMGFPSQECCTEFLAFVVVVVLAVVVEESNTLQYPPSEEEEKVRSLNISRI